ncbi:tetratricopeptide repeat protein [Micromonospora aurantiaca (nom. illeg.)]|uniref:tetratricopeptide repeat protein n=1 Tax=Micromonospora aurantiaca (nom. illeg.) TaxID=47850 RepID=UPI001656E2EF|nr:tetratricopeptide repeat protein [Micromonospora aurantiaca]MBC9001765.1 tetratricopeptide repeat protein [Micromonospora aurantiaca]
MLVGLGGVGKTQLAANLAHRMWQDGSVDLLVWVTATSRSNIIAAYAQAIAPATGFDNTEPEQAAQRFLTWLATTSQRWLVVLDDLIDPDDLTGLWPPHGLRVGHAVVTTRRRDAALIAGREVIDVALFTPAESVAYLNAKLVGLPNLNNDPDGLAADLGHLPLALAQAVAYMIDRNLTCASYRRRYATRQLQDLTPLSLPDQHRAIVGATWQLSIERADRLTAGLAQALLKLAALLDPNGIPTELFTTSAALTYCINGSGETDDDDVRDALNVLRQLSLATLADDGRMLRVHALVQRAVRDSTPPGTSSALAQAAADALFESWPDAEREATLEQARRNNTEALLENSGNSLLRPNIHPVLNVAGVSLGNTGQLAATLNYFDSLYEKSKVLLGDLHPDTLTMRNNRATFRQKAGDLATAIYEFEAILRERSQVLGVDHPDTLTTRNNLATCRGEAGDSAGAAEALALLANDFSRVLGSDDRRTLTTRSNAAHWRSETGDNAGAVAACQAIVNDFERVFGSDDHDTFVARSNLARARGRGGDSAGALASYQKLLADRTRILGPQDPETLATEHLVAIWRGRVGDREGAVREADDVRQKAERLLGNNHPEVLRIRNTLARLLGEVGHLDAAIREFNNLVRDRTSILGPTHPETLITRHNLAECLARLGKLEEAIKLSAAALEDSRRVSGPDDPLTLTVQATVGRLYGERGEAAIALSLHSDLVERHERAHGPVHEATFTVRHNRAHWLAEAGDVRGAIEALAELLSNQLDAWGDNHPGLIATLHSLALWQGRAGAHDDAVSNAMRSLQLAIKELGRSDYLTLIARENVAYWLARRGDKPLALRMYRILLADQESILGPDHPDTRTTRHQIADLRLNP